jgi:NADH-quinone oxidoreductase subunit J
MSALAVYFFFLDAHLLGWFQIIVYAGAVMVLFLFVIMLLNLQTDPHENQKPSLRLAAGVGGAVLLVELFLLLNRSPAPESLVSLPEGYGTVQVLSEKLFTDYVIPFEVTSILLLVAAVGAVVLAKR